MMLALLKTIDCVCVCVFRCGVGRLEAVVSHVAKHAEAISTFKFALNGPECFLYSCIKVRYCPPHMWPLFPSSPFFPFLHLFYFISTQNSCRFFSFFFFPLFFCCLRWLACVGHVRCPAFDSYYSVSCPSRANSKHDLKIQPLPLTA